MLVVDDNDTNRLLLTEQLQAWDMLPEQASGGQAALDMLEAAARVEEPYEVVLLDQSMPGMDGPEVARRISESVPAKPVLLMLTSTSDVRPAEAREWGIAATLSKPLRRSQLFDSLVRATAPPGTEAQPAPAVGTDGPRPIRAHVLVAEDNMTNQLVAVGILRSLGYSADVVANGLEALDALERRDYAAVLMDCHMPEMDGYEATRELRRREHGEARTPVIAMTASALAEDRERCIAVGMDDYVPKPVKPAELVAVLDRWAARRSGDDTVAGPHRLEDS